MVSKVPPALQPIAYDKEARAYLKGLPLEHFMEATAHAMQRKITLESLDLLAARRPEVHVFNELLVQYPLASQRKPGQVVPDNMVVLTKASIRANTSYNVPLEPAGPFWALEYVSKSNKRKDYHDNYRKYEHDLKVPYYLLFDSDKQSLTLHHHDGSRYVSVKPNDHGRYAIKELDLEMGLLEGWVRYWYLGELLPLPADLQRQLDAALRQAEDARRQAEDARRQAEQATLAKEHGPVNNLVSTIRSVYSS